MLAVSTILLGKMAINRSSVSTNSVEKYNGNTVEMLTSAPPSDGILSSYMQPGQLVGYYNGVSDVVQLFVVSGSGFRIMRVG